MRLPNGYGSVVKLSGSRRKPYLARVTLGWTIDEEKGKAIQTRATIGSFKTKKEAMQALSEYWANPYDLEGSKAYLRDLYDHWSEDYFQTIEPSSMRSIRSAWNYCGQIRNMLVKEIRPRHLKSAIQDAAITKTDSSGQSKRVGASASTKERIKSMFNLMFDYAVEHEMADKNWARTFDLSKEVVSEANTAKRSHINFTDAEMQTLWGALGEVPYTDVVLIQCYSGWRPQELGLIELQNVDLDNWVFTGGMKTVAGKGRPVPIHTRIRPLVQKRYEEATALGSQYLFVASDAATHKGSIRLTYDKYRHRFERIVATLELNPEHRPHDPRKTFVTMAKKAGVDEYVLKRIVGHHISDITEAVYTVRDIEWLRKEIEKIP